MNEETIVIVLPSKADLLVGSCRLHRRFSFLVRKKDPSWRTAATSKLGEKRPRG